MRIFMLAFLAMAAAVGSAHAQDFSPEALKQREMHRRAVEAAIKGMPRASRASNVADVQKNADGSIDIYFGPKAPEGKEANWVPTDPARKFELMARFYGPKQEFFDKVWKLPDVEKVAAENTGARQ
jgi:hypothetical protein